MLIPYSLTSEAMKSSLTKMIWVLAEENQAYETVVAFQHLTEEEGTTILFSKLSR